MPQKNVEVPHQKEIENTSKKENPLEGSSLTYLMKGGWGCSLHLPAQTPQQTISSSKETYIKPRN
jgi:hypothetical protein